MDTNSKSVNLIKESNNKQYCFYCGKRIFRGEEYIADNNVGIICLTCYENIKEEV